MEELLTRENIALGVMLFFFIRYGLKALDYYMDKLFSNSNQDHSQFITVGSCQMHRDTCAKGRTGEQHKWERDLSILKQVMFRIGRKLEIEDDILERLIRDNIED